MLAITSLSVDILCVVERSGRLTLLGKDRATQADVTLHMDNRPFEAVWQELNATSELVAYAAQGIVARLSLEADSSRGEGAK